MIAAAHQVADRCCTCGQFPRHGWYWAGGQCVQCRECYEKLAARMMRRQLQADVPSNLVVAGTATVASRSKVLPQ